MSTVHTITESVSVAGPGPVLRDYQVGAIAEARRLARVYRRLLIVAPTGAGKTTIAGEMIRAALARGKRIAFLAHRKELIGQASAKLTDLGVPHGVIQGGRTDTRAWLPVHVASVQTLKNRIFQAPDLVFVDECHRARARTYEELLARWPAAVVVGLTATPVRTDGRGLGDLFDVMIPCPDIGELTSLGYLVPSRVFAPANVDLSNVRVTGDDFDQAQLAAALDTKELVGDIVAHWRRLAADRLTVAFAVNRDHARHIRDEFRGAGVRAESLDSHTRPRLRDQLLADLAGGAIRVLSSVGVLCEGWDCPPVSCAILARATVSLSLYLQMVGRILRPFLNKFDGLVLDHAGNVAIHGLPDDPRAWALRMDKDKAAKPRKVNPKVCPECYTVYGAAARECRPCGWVFTTAEPRRPDVVEGELAEVSAEAKVARYLTIPPDKRLALYSGWLAHERSVGGRPGYARRKYRDLFQTDPPPSWAAMGA